MKKYLFLIYLIVYILLLLISSLYGPTQDELMVFYDSRWELYLDKFLGESYWIWTIYILFINSEK